MYPYLQYQVWLTLALALFCGVQTFRDFGRGNYVWMAVAAVLTIAAVALLFVPIPTHAVKVDIKQ